MKEKKLKKEVKNENDEEESEEEEEEDDDIIEYQSIIGFGDYDPSLIVTLQIIDHKDNNYPRSCIFNEKLEYCGVSVVESEKLKIVIMSNFCNKSLDTNKN